MVAVYKRYLFILAMIAAYMQCVCSLQFIERIVKRLSNFSSTKRLPALLRSEGNHPVVDRATFISSAESLASSNKNAVDEKQNTGRKQIEQSQPPESTANVASDSLKVASNDAIHEHPPNFDQPDTGSNSSIALTQQFVSPYVHSLLPTHSIDDDSEAELSSDHLWGLLHVPNVTMKLNLFNDMVTTAVENHKNVDYKFPLKQLVSSVLNHEELPTLVPNQVRSNIVERKHCL